MNIVFGTKRLSNTSTRSASVEKYSDLAVITVEGIKGAKKSRRILLNKMASELLNLEVGDVQELIFAPVEDTNQVLIANRATIDGDSGDMVSYKTSKNKVSYSESTEKGKAITSSHMCKEIFSFLGKDDTQDIEFMLNEFASDSVEAYSLDAVIADEVENTVSDNVIETNTGSLEVEEVINSVQAQVAQDEETSPMLQRAQPVDMIKEWVEE